MKTCNSEYLGYCMDCGLPCKEVDVCFDSIISLSKDKMNKLDKTWKDKSLKERYEEIERLQNIK